MSEDRVDDNSERSRDELSRLEAIVRPVLQAHRVELFDLVMRRDRAGWVLRIVLDVLDGPGQPPSVTLEQCADVSRDVSTALDVADLLDHAYTLEVSSPGVERPLRSLRDYVRFDGKLARLWLVAAAGGKTSVLQARLGGVVGESIAVVTDGGDRREVPFAHIKKAHLVFENPAVPKERARKPKRSPKPRS